MDARGLWHRESNTQLNLKPSRHDVAGDARPCHEHDASRRPAQETARRSTCRPAVSQRAQCVEFDVPAILGLQPVVELLHAVVHGEEVVQDLVDPGRRCSLTLKDFVGTQGPARDSRETYPENYARYAFPGPAVVLRSGPLKGQLPIWRLSQNTQRRRI